MPEVRLGYITDGGAGYYMSRRFNNNKHLGMYLGLTGKILVGEDSVRYGANTHYIKHADFDKIKEEIVEKYKHSDLKNTTKD